MSEELKPCPFCGGDAESDSHTADCYFNLRDEMMAKAERNSDLSGVPAVLKAWNRRATPPAAQVQGEREAFEAAFLKIYPSRTLLARHSGNPDSYRSSWVLEQWEGWQLRAALSAPPAAGVPEEMWSLIEATVRGAFSDGAKDYRGCMHERLRELKDALAAPTPPASEQQQAFVVPERDDPEMYAHDSSKYWSAVAWNACMDEWLRLNPHLQPAAPSQVGDV